MKTTASVIIGNPSAPCSGGGVCEMNATSIDSDLSFNVDLSSKGSDLTINISSDSMTKLERVRPDIYSNLMSNNPAFSFDNGALPFYLDYYISQKIFPSLGDYNCLDEKTTCAVSKQADGSVDIYFPEVSKSENSKYGTTGSFDGTFLTSGNWEIGVDVYGNLIFKNPKSNTMFIFGFNGNISCNRYSVQLSGHKASIPANTNYEKGFIGSWLLGYDESGNLWITNGNNKVVFTLDNIGFVLNDVNVRTKSVANLPDSQLDSSAQSFGVGSWTIQQDTNGNLCFKSDKINYYFTTDGNIYVGQNINVFTYFPTGNNK